jgi:aspartate/methionine/tyrosine aminotransferase
MKTLSHFRLEEYLAPREFDDNIMFCASDLESRSISDLLSFASEKERNDFFNLSLKYTTPEGSSALRESLAEMTPGLKASHFQCFAGAEEAIYTSARVLLTAEDHAIVITPCYQSLKSIAASICDVSEVSLDIRVGNWHLDVGKIASAIRPNTKVIFVNFPHNPTGFIPSHECFHELIALARKYGIYLFCDEVYQGLSLDPKFTLPSASTLYERALSLGVTSKSFGLAGLRVGWISSQDANVLNKLAQYKHYLSICNSAPSEFLAKIAVDHRQKIWSENHKLIHDNFKLLREYFLKHEDLFEWVQPQGGCTAYPRYLGKERITVVADELLKKHKVVILPDWVYEEENNHFRISFGRKNMLQALALFSDFFGNLRS